MRLIDADQLTDVINRSCLTKGEKRLFSIKIRHAPTVDTFTFDDMKKGINVGYKAGRLAEKLKRPQGNLISREALKDAIMQEVYKDRVGVFVARRIFRLIDNAPTVNDCPYCGAKMEVQND